jgi:hypothetical protein
MWGRVLPEKLTGPQLVKKFLAFDGTRKFSTAFTTNPPSVPVLSQINLVLASPYLPILMLSSQLCLGLPSKPVPSGLNTKTL